MIKEESCFANLGKIVKEKSLQDVAQIESTVVSSFHARRDKDEWIIDSGFSNHIISDKSKFVKIEKYDGGVVRFGDGQTTKILGIGSISLDGKHNTDNVFYVKVLNHNLLSVVQICGNRYNFVFRMMGVRSKKSSELLLQQERGQMGMFIS